MKAWLQSILLLRDNKQQVVTNGYPYLHVDSIAGCAVKGLDVHVLLDPLEEDLYLPSFSIQLCNSECVNRKVVCEESIDLSVSKVLIHNKSEIVVIFLRSIKSRLGNCIQYVVLGSGNKPCVVLMKVLIERIKLHIASIQKVVGICHYRYLVHNLGIMNDASVRRINIGMDPFKSIRVCILKPPLP